MTFDPSTWAWPQWTLFIIMILRLAIAAGLNGKPKVDKDGKPETYSFPIAFVGSAVALFILICGGFYGSGQ